MSTEVLGPSRCMSYNDIKKRRMLRESKSKGKLAKQQPATNIVNTEKKKNISSVNDRFAHQRPNEIQQIRRIKQAGSTKAAQFNNIKETVKRKLSNNYLKQQIAKIEQQEEKAHQKQLVTVNSRQIVQSLIEESKSERRLLKFRELRSKFKQSKSKSKSRSQSSLLEKSRSLAKRLLSIQTTIEKPEEKSENNPLGGIKNSNVKIKKFESVKQQFKNHRYLVNVNASARDARQSEAIVKKKKKKSQNFYDNIESSIEVRKNQDASDQSEQVFLQEICFISRQNSRGKQMLEDKKRQIQQQNLLDLLKIDDRQLLKVISQKQRQKKILKDLEKLNKKFPKGFFKI